MPSLLRVIKFAFQDIGRNLGLSFMTMLILGLMLLSVNSLWSIDVLTREAVRLVKDQVNVSVYLASAATPGNISALQGYLAAFPETKSVRLIDKEAVLTSFRERHQLRAEILEALEELGANPFGPTLVVKTREPADYQKILAALEAPEYEPLIEAKSFDEHKDAISRIQNITNRIESIGVGLSLLFAVIAFLIIFNTIRVAIYTQRREINIKRLVGANNWFIRGPYLVESLVFTVLSMAITMAIIFMALRWIDPYLSVVFPNGFSLTAYYQSHILSLFGLQTLAVLLLTTLSSSLAMRKQLKV